MKRLLCVQHTFLADDYFGSDGYFDQGNYYMFNRILDVAFENNKFDFNDSKPTHNKSKQFPIIKSKAEKINVIIKNINLAFF